MSLRVLYSYVEGSTERNKVPIPLGRGAFNVSNIVQLVEGGCERNKVPIPLGRGAFNVSNIGVSGR